MHAPLTSNAIPVPAVRQLGEVAKGTEHCKQLKDQIKKKRSKLDPIVIAWMNHYKTDSLSIWVEELPTTYRRVYNPTPAQIRSGAVFRLTAIRSHVGEHHIRAYDILRYYGFPSGRATHANCNSHGYKLK